MKKFDIKGGNSVLGPLRLQTHQVEWFQLACHSQYIEDEVPKILAI